MNHNRSEPLPATRRAFLKAAALGTGALAAAGLARPSSAALQPVERNGKPYMKLSLAAYSFNRVLPRSKPQSEWDQYKMTLDDFVEYCADLDLDGTELTGYYFPQQVTDDYLLHLKEKAFRLGLDVSGTAIGNDFCVPEGERRRQELESARNWIDYAAVMGAPVIRIFAGKVRNGDTEEAAIERCIDGINQSLEHAARKGVFLALENHGGITATPEQMLKIVEGVRPSPWFGVNFDSGNFRTDDPYRDLEKIAPYAINAQIKAAVTRDGRKEEAHLPRIIQMLRSADYRGYVVLEYEERDPEEEIPRYIAQLRELIHA